MKQKKEYIIGYSLLFLSLAAMIIKIFVGFDIDEGYAVSMPQRLLLHDRMFADMWEVHQTSSFLPAFFMFLYEKLLHTTDGLVLYLRVIASFIHVCMTFVLWQCFKHQDIKYRFLYCFIYFNFLPKWMMSTDFSMQQIWGLTLVLWMLLLYREKLNKGFLFIAGVMLAFTVLAYPGMVILYPVILCMFLISDKKGEIKSRINNCLILTLGCAGIAIIFFIFVLSDMNLQDLFQNIPMVFMDGTHQFTLSVKLLAYVRQWLNVAKQIGVFAVGSTIISYVIYCFGKKKGLNIEKKTDKWILFFAVWMIVTSLLVLGANIIGLKISPFHFQVRYLGFFIGAFIFCFFYKKKRDLMEREWMILVLASFVGILIFSNVGPDSSSSYLVLGVIIGYQIFLSEIKETSSETNDKNLLECLLYISMVIFVLSLIACKGYYVRATEYVPANILQSREQVRSGPVKGIFLLPEDCKRYENDHEVIQEITKNGESLLFLGTEGILNLSAKSSFVSPSTISTPAFNEQWVLYFDRHPQLIPQVVVIAKNTVDNRDKFFSMNPFGKWLDERFDTEGMEETEYLCIIRRKNQ